jgi:bilirubin oxidase
MNSFGCMLTSPRLIKSPITGKDIRYYEIDIHQMSQKVYLDRGNATLWGYDGISPGPTFVMERGTEAIVRFSNHARLANSVHLHGSYSVSLEDRGCPG